MSGTVTRARSRRSRMGATAAAASLVLTVMRTSSEPARASACTCRAVASTSAVSVLVIDWTTIGAPPPTRTLSTATCTEARRSMLIACTDNLKGCGFYRCRAWAARTGTAIMRVAESVCSERVRHAPERRRRKFRPETRRHTNGRRRNAPVPLRLLESGGRISTRPPTEGERRLRRLISQVTGQKGGRRLAPEASDAPAAVFFPRPHKRRAWGTTNPLVQAAPGTGCAHRRFRRLGHAGAVQLADRRASCGAPRRRCIRRLAHLRRGPQGAA